VTFSIAPPLPPRDPPRPEQLRLLWRVERRKQFRCQIIAPAIYRHPYGQELGVFLEPEDAGNLLHSELARFDYTPLEDKATSLREVLLMSGWNELQREEQ